MPSSSYETDAEFMAEQVAQFLAEGLACGETACLIATAEHREAFSAQLARRAIDVERALASGRLIMLDAAESLSQLMVDGAPDEERFRRLACGILSQCERRSPGRRVRAYGEMVDLLWRDGNQRAGAGPGRAVEPARPGSIRFRCCAATSWDAPPRAATPRACASCVRRAHADLAHRRDREHARRRADSAPPALAPPRGRAAARDRPRSQSAVAHAPPGRSQRAAVRNRSTTSRPCGGSPRSPCRWSPTGAASPSSARTACSTGSPPSTKTRKSRRRRATTNAATLLPRIAAAACSMRCAPARPSCKSGSPTTICRPPRRAKSTCGCCARWAARPASWRRCWCAKRSSA